VIGQKNIAGGQIAVQNLWGNWKIVTFCCSNFSIKRFTFLLARNSIPRATCNDQDIKSLVLIIWFKFASEFISWVLNCRWNSEFLLTNSFALQMGCTVIS
jgi:hypothetical protein